MAALDARRHRDHRPGRRQPLSVRATIARRRTARSRRRSRTSISAARRWCAPPRRTIPHVAVVTDPADYAAGRSGAEGERRRAQLRRPASRWPRRRSRIPPPTTVRSATILRRSTPTARRRAFPSASTCSSTRCRTCAMARIPHQDAAFYRDLAARGRVPRRLRATAGQGAFLQQHRRCRCGVGVREDIRASRRA